MLISKAQQIILIPRIIIFGIQQIETCVHYLKKIIYLLITIIFCYFRKKFNCMSFIIFHM